MCRSLFVPYFSFLLDVSISTLIDGPARGVSDSLKPKKKKQKALGDGSSVGLSFALWHLRLLVLSSLHMCFLYDTVGFLDSARFQVSTVTCSFFHYQVFSIIRAK